MATLSTKNPTLLDFKAGLDPDSTVAQVIEMLDEESEIIQDMTMLEGNLPTGHETTVRTGIPASTWRKFYGGVMPTKSTRAKVRDSIGMLEQYAEVDKDLAELNGNSAAWRLSEDHAHLEGMMQDGAEGIFYGNEATAPEEITGLAPRFNSTSAENGDNVILGGGASTDNTSIWLVVWGPNTVHGIFPKGSEAGLQSNDKGQVTVTKSDGSMYEAYRTHYQWKFGVSVRDWRYVVRIANVAVSGLVKDAATGADIIDLMTQALEQVKSVTRGRPVFYMNKTVRAILRRQIVNKVAASTLTMDSVAGKRVMFFDEVPVRRTDAIISTEALVS